MTLAEGLLALFRTGVEHGAVGEDDSGADHHTIAVGMYAAVHTRGIVDDDTAHHGRTDGGRVGWEHTSVGFQDLIHPRTYDARLEFDGFLVLANLVFLPVLACYDQHALGTALS